MAHEVVFAPEAQSDLLDIYDYIAVRSAPARALGFTERLVSYCTIAFHVTTDTVIIDRILYGGRDLPQALP